MKVLLVDDDHLVIEGLCKMIDWKSLDADIVGTAENGKEALSIAIANKPDVIITDVSMSVMDGLEFTRLIREQMEDVHIFFLSGHDDFEYARQAIKYGVKNYILKPVNRETINGLVDELKKIQQQQKIQKELYTDLLSKQQEKEIITALKNGDEDFFNNTFDEVTKKSEAGPNNTVTICLKLLSILYEYFQQININNDIIESSRQKSFEGMFALKSRISKLNYVFEKYYDVLGSIETQKKMNCQSIAISAKNIVDNSFKDSELNISYIADKLGCSAAYLSTVFRNSAGVNLSIYITTMRIEYAKELLSNLNNSISNVSQIVGYADSHYFAKLFKKKIGLTPTEFRNLSIQSNIED